MLSACTGLVVDSARVFEPEEMERRRKALCGSGIRRLGICFEIGRKVSKPLAMDQGRPLRLASFWTSRAVMSMAST